MNNRIGEGHMDPLEEEAFYPAMPQGTIGHGAQTSEEVQLATDRPQTNDRRKIHMRLEDATLGTGVMRTRKKSSSDSDRRGNPEPLSGGNDAQARHSRDATPMATAFEPLNRSMETIVTR